ncbi:glycosyltransferase family 1 protein [Noviherbaspirillum cavernae]|uniref:Glycosyltransferase family 1 protein n=1 Tax=Noviherbaspirillum cavernae TaxID=2320862 RepID=A0A418X0G8_9BURK|nr:glycosyltransferase family 4 protein [Noviherbaspirillum cavernae]RJG05833.1 glycosyltransferase family 1 protein [Noviherbaspirillum cavernae]
MNIMQVSQNYFVSGGSDTYFFAVSSLLSERNHNVIPFSAYNEKNLPSKWARYFPKTYKEAPNKAVGLVKYFYSNESRRSITELLRAEKIDMAHLHIYYGSLTSSILEPLKQANIPVVQTLHEYKLVCPVYTLENHGNLCNKCVTGSSLNGIIHRCKNGSLMDSTIRVAENGLSRMLGDVRLVDKFISVSDFHRRKMIEGGIQEQKIVTVHNFIDADAIECSDEDEAYALYFGRIEKVKGIQTLLRAFKNLPLKLVMAGEGSALGYSRELAADLQLNNVEFVGFKNGSQLHRLIRQARFCIVPSEWYENCPMAVLEAMAHGKAVVASNIGGIPELVRNGTDGYLFEPKSVEQLRDCCLKLSMRSRAREMGHNARKHVEADFSKSAHYQKIMDVYKSISPEISMNA